MNMHYFKSSKPAHTALKKKTLENKRGKQTNIELTVLK